MDLQWPFERGLAQTLEIGLGVDEGALQPAVSEHVGDGLEGLVVGERGLGECSAGVSGRVGAK